MQITNRDDRGGRGADLGFAAFDLDPGSHRGDFTTIKVTYYDVVGADGQVAPFETFTLRRPRRD